MGKSKYLSLILQGPTVLVVYSELPYIVGVNTENASIRLMSHL